MKITSRFVCISILILAAATLLFVGTSFIPRKGDYVVNGTRLRDTAYRDVRGMPFVFLKRSLADGECDIRDVQLRLCNPTEGNEPHQVIAGYAIVDVLCWIGMSTLVAVPVWRIYARKSHASK